LEQAVDALSSSKNLYDYYVANGFAGFWPSRFLTLASTILSNIVSAPTVSTYGVSLPTAKLMCEPLLLSVFNLASNTQLNGLADQIYSAHEARYTATGKFAAFSEGNTGLSGGPSYVYEWVVKDDGSTWYIEDVNQAKSGISPIIYLKAAVGLLAVHDAAFTENMVSYLESQLPNPGSGYSDGVDESGRVDTSDVDKTNGMIIGAALYATNNLSPPTPTPVPGSSPTLSPSASPTSSPNSSTPPSLKEQLTNYGVIVFIALLLVVCVVRFAQLTTGYRKKKSSDPLFPVNCSYAPIKHRYFPYFLGIAPFKYR